MILGIDQGTTSTRAVLLNERGRLLGSFSSSVPQHFPQPGWVEHDPDDIWKSVGAAIQGALNKLGRKASEIQCIGITNQRETVSLFEDQRALHRFIVWQDRRTAEDCKKLAPYHSKIEKLSGTPIDPYFSSTKIKWLLKKLKIRRPSAGLRFRTIDSFLFSKLCGQDAIEATNAHRTQLLDLEKVEWSQKLLELFEIPQSLCPAIVPSEGIPFKTKNCEFLPDGIPVTAALGDQQAALFGQLAWTRGSGKITFGTGSFILVHTGNRPLRSKQKLVSTLARVRKNGAVDYALEGSVFISGAWIQFLRDQLKLISSSDEIEALALGCESSEGVMVFPGLSGFGAPFWKPAARGGILGLTRGSQRAHVARASLEALAFQNYALIDSIQKDSPGFKMKEWKVDGGAVKNNLLLQIQSDLLKTDIIRPQNLEATGTGIALLAGSAHGLLSLEEIKEQWRLDQHFQPDPANTKKLRDQYQKWRETLDHSF